MTSSDPLSVTEAADVLGLDPAEVYRLVLARRLRSVAAPNGRRLVPRDALEEFVHSGHRSPTS